MRQQATADCQDRLGSGKVVALSAHGRHHLKNVDSALDKDVVSGTGKKSVPESC
jgi:hypothetical protein